MQLQSYDTACILQHIRGPFIVAFTETCSVFCSWTRERLVWCASHHAISGHADSGRWHGCARQLALADLYAGGRGSLVQWLPHQQQMGCLGCPLFSWVSTQKCRNNRTFLQHFSQKDLLCKFAHVEHLTVDTTRMPQRLLSGCTTRTRVRTRRCALASRLSSCTQTGTTASLTMTSCSSSLLRILSSTTPCHPGPIPSELQQLTMLVHMNEECEEHGTGYTLPITNNMICAGYWEAGHSSCHVNTREFLFPVTFWHWVMKFQFFRVKKGDIGSNESENRFPR